MTVEQEKRYWEAVARQDQLEEDEFWARWEDEQERAEMEEARLEREREKW